MKHNDNNIRMKGKEKAFLLSAFSFLLSPFLFLVNKSKTFHKKPMPTLSRSLHR